MHCGASTEPHVRCFSCSQLQPVSNQFCLQCGAALTGAAWASPPPDAGAVVDGVWQRGLDEFVRRVAPEEARSFLGNRVVRVPPGTVGVVLVDGVVDRVLPPGQQTTVSLFGRIANFFGGHAHADRTAFYLVDLRPIPIPFTVETRLSQGGRTLQTQLLVSLRVERFERDRLGALLTNALAGRASLGAGELYQALRPEVTQIATSVLERLAARGEVRWADAEAEIRREVQERIEARWALAVDVTVAPLAATTTLDLHLGPPRGARARPCGKCGAELPITMKFCDRCGTPQKAASGAAAEVPALVTADGQEIEIDLVVRVRGQDDALDRGALEATLSSSAAAHLRAILLGALASGAGFAALEATIRGKAAALVVAAGIELLSLGLVDVRSVGGEWLLGARADLNRAQDEVKIGRAWLTQRSDELDLLGLTLAQTVARQRVERAHKLQELELELAARQGAQAVGQGHADLDVAEAQRAAARDQGITEAQRTAERARAAGKREDELDAVAHGSSVAERKLAAEIAQRKQKGALESEEARRRADDGTYEARARAELAQDVADREQARQLGKLEKMAELDARIAAQEHEQKKELRSMLAGLDEKRAIAVQAAELAKTEGGGAAWAAALSGKDEIAAAERRLEQAERHAADMKAVLERQADRLERLAEGGAANQAYARSVDAMSRVAASRAAPDAVVAAVGVPAAAPAPTPCPTCGAALRPEARFCGACGQTRTP